MAHFAKLDNKNNVISVEAVNNAVITDKDGNEQEQLGVDFLTNLYGGGWYKQTSYSRSFRKNFAGTGFTYDGTRDAFIPPKPYSSWSLNETTCNWQSPTDYPEDGKSYMWDEELQDWVALAEQTTE